MKTAYIIAFILTGTVLLSCKKERIDPELEGNWRFVQDSTNTARYAYNNCDEYFIYFSLTSSPPNPCYLTITKEDVQLCNNSCVSFFAENSDAKRAWAKDGQIYFKSTGFGFRVDVDFYFDYDLVGDTLWVVRETSSSKVDAMVEGMRFVQ